MLTALGVKPDLIENPRLLNANFRGLRHRFVGFNAKTAGLPQACLSETSVFVRRP